MWLFLEYFITFDFILLLFHEAASAIASAAYSDRSVCHLSVFRVVYCGQTVEDRPIVCIEVE